MVTLQSPKPLQDRGQVSVGMNALPHTHVGYKSLALETVVQFGCFMSVCVVSRAFGSGRDGTSSERDMACAKGSTL